MFTWMIFLLHGDITSILVFPSQILLFMGHDDIGEEKLVLPVIHSICH